MPNQYMSTLALLATMQCTNIVYAQSCTEPTNERCDGAIEFVFDDLPLTINGLLGCENNMVDRPYFDLFYRYDCTVAGNYQFDMCGSTGDSYMRIYFDGCGFLPASEWIEDDDGCPGTPNTLDPMITINLEAGRSYWIEVGAWRPAEQFPPNANDPFILNVEYQGVCPADLNTDGVADFFDVSFFISLFVTNDLRADFNNDSELNFFDVSLFLQQFLTNCP